MIKFRSLVLALMVLALIPTQLACVNPCEVAAPLIDKGEAMLPEANTALAQASDIVNAMPDGSAKDHAKDALRDAAMGLRLAQEGLANAREWCSAPNLAEVFRTFADAWRLVRPIVGNTGGKGGFVPDPEAYRVGMGE